MSEVKISELPGIVSGSVADEDLLVLVHNGVTYRISIGNLRQQMLNDYNLTSASLSTSSNIDIPTSNAIYRYVNSLTASIHISSSQTVNNDNYRDILVTTGTGSMVLSLSGVYDGKITNITKIDSGSGYVLLSSSYAGNTVLNSSYFGLYYQQECVNLRFNSSSLNYDLI